MSHTSSLGPTNTAENALNVEITRCSLLQAIDGGICVDAACEHNRNVRAYHGSRTAYIRVQNSLQIGIGLWSFTTSCICNVRVYNVYVLLKR